jgi:hypothetical protein
MIDAADCCLQAGPLGFGFRGRFFAEVLIAGSGSTVTTNSASAAAEFAQPNCAPG